MILFGLFVGSLCSLTPSWSTRNFLMFVNTTSSSYHQNPEALVDLLPICNSNYVHKHRKITSTWHYCLELIGEQESIIARGVEETQLSEFIYHGTLNRR